MKSELLRRGRGLATITQSEPLLLRCSVFVWEVQHSPGAGMGPWQEVGAALLLSWATMTCRGLLLRTLLF